jgi:hypothetical protein
MNFTIAPAEIINSFSDVTTTLLTTSMVSASSVPETSPSIEIVFCELAAKDTATMMRVKS